MTILTSQMSLILLFLLSVNTFHKSISEWNFQNIVQDLQHTSNKRSNNMSSNHMVVQCNEKDRETLLIFKKGIIDPFDMISTWTTEKDCCAWEGVHCDNITNRVTKLDLNTKPLEGEINLCILQLEFLTYLDLSYNEFDVINIPTIPHNITHASKLLYLDLSFNYSPDLHIDNLNWLSPLSSLKYLNLSRIDLHKETNWLQVMATLPSLLELQLSGCNLNNFVIDPSFEYVNLTSLVTLVLSENNFNSKLPEKLFNLTKDLFYLDLSSNNLHGEIPSTLSNLQNLRLLDLSHNQLTGSIPNEIGQLKHIQYLDLSINMLSGFVLSTLGNLSSLHYLSIGYNYFSGEISKVTFSKLYSLVSLDLTSSKFLFQIDLEWVPPFQLHTLLLSDTNQGPNFPSWIYTQKSLKYLNLSNSQISVVDRKKFPSFIEGIPYLYLSNNLLMEDISNLTMKSYYLELDHNNFTGGLPNISPKANKVDLSYNSFSGSIPHSWKNLKELFYLNLWSNRLSGEGLVHLSNWKNLAVMNIGENKFSGTIPIKMSKKLQVIILRDNKFEGTIPTQLFNLPSLFHLDLAHNKLLGSLPKCVYNLTQMITLNVDGWYLETIDLFTKGHDYVYDVRPERRTFDLSVNNLVGEVPLELFRLVQVQTLNLSHNNFMRTIPKTIGHMKNMESLDLSYNKLFGEIPQSMALLNFLDYMNISYNNFFGKIPIGTQLQSFDPSCYIGNPKLCGHPLKICTTKDKNPRNATRSIENEDDESLRDSLYLGMGVGFAVSFWGFCGSLFVIRKWRHAYYQFLDRVVDNLYVTLMVKLNSFHRNRAPTS